MNSSFAVKIGSQRLFIIGSSSKVYDKAYIKVYKNLNGALRVAERLTAGDKQLQLGENEEPITSDTTNAYKCMPHADNLENSYTQLVLAFLAGVERVEGGVENFQKMTAGENPVQIDHILRRFADSEVPEYRDFDAIWQNSIDDLSTKTKIGWFLRDQANGGQNQISDDDIIGTSFLLKKGRVKLPTSEISMLEGLFSYLRPGALKIMGITLKFGQSISALGEAWHTHVVHWDGLGRTRTASLPDERSFVHDLGKPNLVKNIEFRCGKIHLIIEGQQKSQLTIPYSPEELDSILITTAPDPVIIA